MLHNLRMDTLLLQHLTQLLPIAIPQTAQPRPNRRRQQLDPSQPFIRQLVPDPAQWHILRRFVGRAAGAIGEPGAGWHPPDGGTSRDPPKRPQPAKQLLALSEPSPAAG